MSDVSGVTNYFATANEGFITTLSSSILSGAATIPLTSVSGLTNGSVFVGIIEPGLTKQQVFTGTVDTGGAQITGVKYTRGSNAAHSAGVTIVDYVTGTGFNMHTAGILKQHSQTGAHTAITAASLAATGALSTSAGDITATVGKVTTAAVGKLEDRGIPLDTYRAGMVFDYVVSGGVWTADSVGVNLNASMTAITVMINGQLLNSTNSPALAAVTARAFTTNVDTYIDVLNTAGVGTIVYTTAVTNAASPALAANSLRIGIIQAAATITATTKVNQGQEDRVFPIASSIPYAVTDSLGNLICPRDPNRRIIGYRQAITNLTSTTSIGSGTDMTGLNLNCIIPAGRKVKVSGFIGAGSASVANNAVGMELFDVTAGAIIASSDGSTNASGDAASATPTAVSSAGGTRNYKARLFRGSNAATANSNGTATNPNYIVVELI